jgi:hypothetical protein
LLPWIASLALAMTVSFEPAVCSMLLRASRNVCPGYRFRSSGLHEAIQFCSPASRNEVSGRSGGFPHSEERRARSRHQGEMPRIHALNPAFPCTRKRFMVRHDFPKVGFIIY